MIPSTYVWARSAGVTSLTWQFSFQRWPPLYMVQSLSPLHSYSSPPELFKANQRLSSNPSNQLYCIVYVCLLGPTQVLEQALLRQCYVTTAPVAGLLLHRSVFCCALPSFLGNPHSTPRGLLWRASACYPRPVSSSVSGSFFTPRAPSLLSPSRCATVQFRLHG